MERSFNPVCILPDGRECDCECESPMCWTRDERPVNPMSANIMDDRLSYAAAEYICDSFGGGPGGPGGFGSSKKRKQIQHAATACKHGRSSSNMYNSVESDSEFMNVEQEEHDFANDCRPQFIWSEMEGLDSFFSFQPDQHLGRTHQRVVSDESTFGTSVLSCN